MKNRMITAIAAVTFLFALRADAVEVLNKRFDPPRIYMTSASLNKSGRVFALRGQDNVLRLFLPGIEKETECDLASLRYEVELPGGCVFLPDDRDYPHTGPQSFRSATRAGGDVLIVGGALDPELVRARCLRATYGVDANVWFRADDLAVGNDLPLVVRLFSGETEIFSDEANLRVFEALTAPPVVPARHFRFYLHYGPAQREGRWDEVAHILRNAGINTVMYMAAGDIRGLREMRERGFYTIAQRLGSYSKAVPELNRLLAEGPEWFERQDAGAVRAAAPDSDAILWDFEPRPDKIATDDETLALFREAAGIAPHLPLDENSIRESYLEEWMDFRQGQLAGAVIHWANWVRSIKDGIDTIMVEGNTQFNTRNRINYARYGGHVSVCSPMNFNGLAGVLGMKQWKEYASEANFQGCVNLAYQQHSPVFVSAHGVMLQIASSAFIGNSGIEIYPGQTMDAENFVAFNRIMTLLGRYRDLIWEGRISPANASLEPLPKEDFEVALGEGRTIRHVYPDWGRNAVTRSYGSPDGGRYLFAVVNWHASEPCYARLRVTGLRGGWMLTDPERDRAYTLNGSAELASSALAGGCLVKFAHYDYGALTLEPYNAEVAEKYEMVALENVDKEYEGLRTDGRQDSVEGAASGISFGRDDRDGDNQLEYKITTPSQTVWISASGNIIHWEAGGAVLSTKGAGLCRDMLWLPVTERGNPALDAPMAVEAREAYPDRAELVLSRDVPLPSLDATAEMRIRRRFGIAADRPEIEVEVEIENRSLDLRVMTLSYRVHNFLGYPKAAGDTWIYDGGVFKSLGLARNLIVPNPGLGAAERELVGVESYPLMPMTPARFGEYFADDKTLLSITPRDPAEILQILRWLSADESSGTQEWMYRPVEIPNGANWKTSFKLRLQGEVDKPDAESLGSESKPAPLRGPPERLLFHADFNDTVEARVAAGGGEPDVATPVAYQDTPTGRGLLLKGEGRLRYEARGNIDLGGGRMLARFKPLWGSLDSESRYVMRVRVGGEWLNIGKISDGRLIMNHIDGKGAQRWVATPSPFRAGDWYELLCVWDAERGRQSIYLDGVKVAETEREPWKTTAPGRSRPEFGMFLYGAANIVIDDIKIWGRI